MIREEMEKKNSKRWYFIRRREGSQGRKKVKEGRKSKKEGRKEGS